MKPRKQRHTVEFEPSIDNLYSRERSQNPRHSLKARVDQANASIYLDFSTRLAMYEFALSLAHEAPYGKGGVYERGPSDGLVAVEGVRLTNDSSRLFAFYDSDSPTPDESQEHAPRVTE